MVGEGIVTLGVWPAVTCARRKTKSAFWMSLSCRTGPTTRITGGAQLLAAVGLLDEERRLGPDAAELLQEIDVEVGAPELAVGDAGEADIFLEADDLGDGVVFRRPAAVRP